MVNSFPFLYFLFSSDGFCGSPPFSGLSGAFLASILLGRLRFSRGLQHLVRRPLVGPRTFPSLLFFLFSPFLYGAGSPRRSAGRGGFVVDHSADGVIRCSRGENAAARALLMGTPAPPPRRSTPRSRPPTKNCYSGFGFDGFF